MSDFGQVGLEWGLRSGISDKIPGNADALRSREAGDRYTGAPVRQCLSMSFKRHVVSF